MDKQPNLTGEQPFLNVCFSHLKVPHFMIFLVGGGGHKHKFLREYGVAQLCIYLGPPNAIKSVAPLPT